MKKYTLIKFFRGEASKEEMDSIIRWINESPANKKYFASERELFNVMEMAENKDTADTFFKGDAAGDKSAGRSYSGKSRVLSIVTYCASAAAIAAIFFVAGYLLKPKHDRLAGITKVSNILPHKPVIHTLYTEKGVKGFVVLPDSSRVWLNSDSKITYPEGFNGRTRNVSISGEAYFEVQKDSLHPMIVMTNKNFSLEVLGTSFNIKSYDNEDNAMATLYTGSIKMHYRDVNTSKISTIKLKPNETFNYTPKLAEVKQFISLKPENDKAWKDGALVFEDTPMPEVIKMLERWHGTKFIVKNDEIYQYKLSAVFTSESIVQSMEIMRLIMPIKYSCKNNVVTLE